MSQVPVDLHHEPKKIRTALISLALIGFSAAFFTLSFSVDAPASGLQIYRPTLVPIPPDFAFPQPPVAVAQSEPEPPAPPQPAPKPTPSKAELALKQAQDSLEAERERREEEERKEREEDEQRKAEEERKQKEEEKKKREEEERKREEEERKQREREEQRKAEDEQRKEEARKRREEEAERRVREQEERAAELRAQADAAARAAEVARLAGLREIYMGRIRAQIETQMDTPAALVGREDVVVEVRVLLHSDGELKGWPKVIRSSGFSDYDEEAIRAVIQASPLLLPSDEPELLREFLQLNLRIRPQ